MELHDPATNGLSIRLVFESAELFFYKSLPRIFTVCILVRQHLAFPSGWVLEQHGLARGDLLSFYVEAALPAFSGGRRIIDRQPIVEHRAQLLLLCRSNKLAQYWAGQRVAKPCPPTPISQPQREAL